MKYAEVAVNAPLSQPRTFTYSIPPGMLVDAGHAVWVPFGPKLLQGVIFELSDQPSVPETRDIAEAIDSRPLLLPHQVRLARWIAPAYLCSFFSAAALMLPPGFERRVLTLLKAVAEPSALALSSLGRRQREVLDLVRRRGRVELLDLKKELRSNGIDAVVGQLVRKGLLTRTRELQRPKVRPRVVLYLRLSIAPEQARELVPVLIKRRAPQQARLLELLLGSPQPVALPELCTEAGISTAVARTLVKKGLVALQEVRHSRDPLAHRTFAPSTPLTLNPAQDTAWREVQAALRGRGEAGRPTVFLLHGVTGSGKTEVYLRALAETVSQGKRGLVLVPEIALTPQTIARFAGRFPGRVAVLHSRLSIGEQFDEWERIREGEFDVVIGSRSALFAPQPDLGLIVMDEEHEWTYKQQEQAPRYHSRDVAVRLAELTGAVVLLGSATPDLGTYHRAERGEISLLELPQRIAQSELPKVEIVDLRKELKEGNRSIFSRSLHRSIEQTLAAGEQIILFLNRRGSGGFVQCRDCGLVLRCRRCEVSLTYHAQESSLVCHQCNYRIPPPSRCPQCWGRRIRFLGLGTERLEEDTAYAFPQARVLRWDRDVTRGKHSHERILERFLNHGADILIGTQMIAKGLDLPLVTLVGVICADIGLHLPDFRAGERTFQVLAQVAGRAGRGELGGKVIIQTYTPNHYALTAAARHDYASFYRRELDFRREHAQPPFSRLARLLYAHTNAVACEREAHRMHKLLEQEAEAQGLHGAVFIGPSPAYVSRLRGRYRWQMLVRAADPLALLSQVAIPQGWIVDIDPATLL